MTASGCALQARAIAEKFVLKKPPPGESYTTDPWSVTTNPVGHPTHQYVLVLHNRHFEQLIEEVLTDPLNHVARNLARDDLFKPQRDFLKEQATRMDSLPLEGGSGRGLLS